MQPLSSRTPPILGGLDVADELNVANRVATGGLGAAAAEQRGRDQQPHKGQLFCHDFSCHYIYMSLRRIAEGRIREAIEQGVFENLPGAGKPLDLEEYFNTPEDLRMAFSILKNANCAPVEVELMKEVARLEQAIAETRDAPTAKELHRTLVHRRIQLAIFLERRRKR